MWDRGICLNIRRILKIIIIFHCFILLKIQFTAFLSKNGKCKGLKDLKVQFFVSKLQNGVD